MLLCSESPLNNPTVTITDDQRSLGGGRRNNNDYFPPQKRLRILERNLNSPIQKTLLRLETLIKSTPPLFPGFSDGYSQRDEYFRWHSTNIAIGVQTSSQKP